MPFFFPAWASETGLAEEAPAPWRRRQNRGSGGRSPLDVGELLGHFSSAHAEEVYAADMARCSVLIHPVVPPPDPTSVLCGEDLLRREASVGGRGEEVLPERPHRALSRVPIPVGRGTGVLEYAILGHGGHDPVHVLAVKRLREQRDRIEGGRGRRLPVR